MSSAVRLLCRSLTAGLALLAGCAQMPAAPPPAPAPVAVQRLSPQDERLRLAVAKHQQLANQAKQSGDLATAATQYQILTLLAPNDATFRNDLAATRTEIARRVKENLAAGNAAQRSGDTDRAADAMLRVLALDPENAEAAKSLREIEAQRLSRIQAGRAAKAGGSGVVGNNGAKAVPRTATSAAGDAYELEQPLEMFKAGDTAGGLRDLKAYVEANPTDKAARNRIGTAVYDRARELEDQGAREQALPLFEQAVALRGEAGLGWTARIQALKKTLGNEYFDKGVQAWPTNAAQAVKDWETSLRYDPQNAKAAARLRDARQAEAKAAPAKK